jgi:tetratricopeptide (TPR) repeat protein
MRLQEQSKTQPTALAQLGWAFIQKARVSFDPGFYKLAEQCAVCMEAQQPDSPEALLLRAHALNNLHRFKEAEPLAHELVRRRGMQFDYGVLGDTLMEQGRLAEAVDVYQKMIDLKPGPQSYTRAAHVRWLKGDLPGAIELMRMAAQASGPSEPESAAWSYTKLGMYALQQGALPVALEACNVAIEIQHDYAPALLAKGRALISAGKVAQAVDCLRRAAELNPLPEYQWALADALRIEKRPDEAEAVERTLENDGQAGDPRSFALYLATRGKQLDTAVALTRKELETRGDVFTQDALAWALASAGRATDAAVPMARALAEGTRDARLFLHAGKIAALTGDKRQARDWLNKAQAIRQMLLPSERELLSTSLAAL